MGNTQFRVFWRLALDIRTAAAALDAGLKVAEPDLSIPLLRTVIAVFLKTDMSVNDLADTIGVPQQSASRYVAILQGRYQTSDGASSFTKAPLLMSKPSPTDSRRNELALTPHGEDRLNEILSQIHSKEALHG